MVNQNSPMEHDPGSMINSPVDLGLKSRGDLNRIIQAALRRAPRQLRSMNRMFIPIPGFTFWKIS